MKKNQKRIQTTLIIVGFLLILSTYFFYPFIVEKKTIVEKITVGEGSVTKNFTFRRPKKK